MSIGKNHGRPGKGRWSYGMGRQTKQGREEKDEVPGQDISFLNMLKPERAKELAVQYSTSNRPPNNRIAVGRGTKRSAREKGRRKQVRAESFQKEKWVSVKKSERRRELGDKQPYLVLLPSIHLQYQEGKSRRFE